MYLILFDSLTKITYHSFKCEKTLFYPLKHEIIY